MAIEQLESLGALTDRLGELTEQGLSQAAALPGGRYSDVVFLVCTDPDGEWFYLGDRSGDNLKFRTYPIGELHDVPYLLLTKDYI
ncbi:hypothetical protein [Agromyces humi]|uniref:hypothetical protein n=1 Tax=Agromyces humi TaxID=1766800 RepID=UPI0013587A34|nr:hypothetical protein [Agromyces humi]